MSMHERQCPSAGRQRDAFAEGGRYTPRIVNTRILIHGQWQTYFGGDGREGRLRNTVGGRERVIE